MLSRQALLQMGVAKRGQIRMMRDRGHALPELEARLLDADAGPEDIVRVYSEAACRLGCSLGEAMSGTYVAAPKVTQGRLPDITTVVFLDPQWEDAKRRRKAASTDQVKTALDATRVAHAERVGRGLSAAGDVPALIIVSQTAPTPDAKREIMDVGDVAEGGSEARADEGVRVQVIQWTDLFVLPTAHAITPRHVRLSEDDARELFVRCKMHPTQLPEMRDTEAVAAYYGYRPGDVIAVTRPGGSVEYRLVMRDV